MDNQQAIQMAERCIEEISMLRARLAEVEPKAHAYDAITQILGLLPQRSQSYAEDIVWRLKKQIAELKEAEGTSPLQPATD